MFLSGGKTYAAYWRHIERIIELEPSAEDMPTYISMDSFRHKLASYFDMEEY